MSALPRFSIPIEGLKTAAEWTLGAVRLVPAGELQSRFHSPAATDIFLEAFGKATGNDHHGAIAEADADSLEEALQLVGQAVDVLRVLQHVRYGSVQLTHFGLAGEITRNSIPYMEMSDTSDRYGWCFRGPATGWNFSDESPWDGFPGIRWTASLVGSDDLTDGERRALVGIESLSQAILERRPALKMVLLVTALEAWLLPRRSSGQTFRLARAVSYFSCGRHAGELCGRDRDTCPYLGIDPSAAGGPARLKQLRQSGAAPPWRCAEWHRVVDWYDMRSDIVHGAGPTISKSDADNAVYWVYRWLAEPVLEFLSGHVHDPIGALETALDSLPEMPDWEERLGPLA